MTRRAIRRVCAYNRTQEFDDALSELLVQAARQPTAMMCSEAAW